MAMRSERSQGLKEETMIEQQDTPIADRVSPQAANPCSDVDGSVLHSSTRHFSPAEIAELWHLSVDTVRRLFEHEPGVVVIEPPAGRHSKRRRYRTIRIPERVIDRVHRRLSVVNGARKQ